MPLRQARGSSRALGNNALSERPLRRMALTGGADARRDGRRAGA